jgi:hypothetical protein
MKSVRLTLWATTLGAVLFSLATVALAQSDTHQMGTEKSAAPKSAASKPAAPKSEAEVSFDTIKTMAGEWEGVVTVPEMPQMSNGKPLHISLRVTSRGHVLVHEMQEAGTPLDFMKYDHPVTMVYLDGDQLNLIHYCDAGNRPRMTGKLSADGKQVEFTFQDITGDTKYGHMDHALFSVGDENHHNETWTFVLGNGKVIHATFQLHRVAGSESASLVK